VSRLNKSSAPILCYVTYRRSLIGANPSGQRETLLQKIEAATQAGVDWIQIREKDLSGKDCSLLVGEALRRANGSIREETAPPCILVNDRLDIALAERAGGVHLGEESLPLAEAVRLGATQRLERNFLIGVSCHSLEAARAAAAQGANYLFFGSIFPTPSKAAFGAPQGLERLAEVCCSVSIPVLAIGGITESNASECLASGASGIAAIRLFQDTSNLSSLVQKLQLFKRPGLRV